jgi:DNA-directed RNA polymerase subunit E'/Rpb7
MEKFPELDEMIHIDVPEYLAETEKLNIRVQRKLQVEEYKITNEYRKDIYDFYDKYEDAITGEYSAELEDLRKMLDSKRKEYMKRIIDLRKTYIKEKVQPEKLEPQPVPKRRIRPGDSLSQRFQAGDDFIQEVRKLPRDFQDKINEEIEDLTQKKDERIDAIRQDFIRKREQFWEGVSKGRAHSQKLEQLRQIDIAEDGAIKDELRRFDSARVYLRKRYIEVYNLNPQMKLSNFNLPRSDESAASDYNELNEGELAKNLANVESTSSSVSVSSPLPQTKPKPETHPEVDMNKLFIKSIIHERISIPFSKVSNNMTRFFENYAEKKIEGKCRNEGFIRLHSSNVVSYSTGVLMSDKVVYNVVYSVDVCYPYEGMEIDCKIKNITKIGIRAVISEHENPIILFISREHNPDKNFDDYKENERIKVKVLGHRFELNDEYISVIGELM